MTDGTSRVGSSRAGGVGLDLLRQLGVTGGAAASSDRVVVAADATADGGKATTSWFGPRGSRVLPADFPEDQLDRRALRGTYIDILV